MKEIIIYSDGACAGNPGPGGWGSIIVYKDIEKEISGGDVATTNNRMELTGVIEALKHLKEPCSVKIVSDSKYVVEGINSWLKGWIAKNFNKVKNPELWQDYIKVSQGHKITAEWVRGHNGHPMNERCDGLAVIQRDYFKSL